MHRALVAIALLASLAAPVSSNGLASLRVLWSEPWSDSFSKEGCRMDPFGRCNPAPQPQPEAGCGMDPSGCPGGVMKP